MVKYEFSIRNREGQKIESLVIAGVDQPDAERKLLQMYRHCEVLSCTIKTGGPKLKGQANSLEDILSLISH
ncbi:MAG TPA: hypothetical protein VGO51_12895 [Burkholderiaceae bacterium]|jgi:hypothetical protein|nr:hypothetical protein [Burkholderiaceae bacterium]